MMQVIAFFLSALIVFAGCCRFQTEIYPQLQESVQDTYLATLPSPFPSLTVGEQSERWGEEYTIAQKFAKELDFYRAITAFKRTEFLLVPTVSIDRRAAIQYHILLCYYLGKRYDDAIQTFTRSTLYKESPALPFYSDLLVVLYDSYLKTGDQRKGHSIVRTIEQIAPETAEKLALSTALIQGDLKAVSIFDTQDPLKTDLKAFLTHYDTQKKSVRKAQVLNAFLPGAGYLYVGQKQSALTSFLLNGLSIWAAIHFYSHKHIAAGILTTSLEVGWYFGGIYGVGESARLYNERLYEKGAFPLLHRHSLFPVFLLKYGF